VDRDVSAGVILPERFGLLVAPPLEAHQPPFQGLQIREVRRLEGFALHDRELPSDLVQPVSVSGQMDHRHRWMCGLDAP